MAVSRYSRLIVGAEVMWERSWENMQGVADTLPQANCYCSDDLAVYSELIWPDCPDYELGWVMKGTVSISSPTARKRRTT